MIAIGCFPDYTRILHNKDHQSSCDALDGDDDSGSGVGVGGSIGGGGGGGIPPHDVENPYYPSPTHHPSTSHSLSPCPDPGSRPGPGLSPYPSRGNFPSHPLPPVLQADDLCVVYPSSTLSSHLALKGVTFSLQPGEKVALMGMNGGGKSTLFKALALGETTPCDGK